MRKPGDGHPFHCWSALLRAREENYVTLSLLRVTRRQELGFLVFPRVLNNQESSFRGQNITHFRYSLKRLRSQRGGYRVMSRQKVVPKCVLPDSVTFAQILSLLLTFADSLLNIVVF